MRVTWQDVDGKEGRPIVGPADLTTVTGGVVTLRGVMPEKSRTMWSMHIGNYVTRGGTVRWDASG